MTLQAYLPLDENSGSTVYDYSVNGNNATVSGANQGVTGILGTTAYDFDGSDDYVEQSYISAYDVTEFTACFWFKSSTPRANGSQSNGHFMSNGMFDSPGWGVRDNSDNHEFVVQDSSGNRMITKLSSPSFYDGNWHFLANVYDSSKNKGTVYVDGEQVDSDQNTNLSGEVSQSGTTLNYGVRNRSGGGRRAYYNGTLEECRFYNHALTQAEVQYLYDVTQSGSFRSTGKVI